ncbi:MAG: nucleotide pyrophosphohydrolase [Propionibacteriaceae bacterium]|nr:nucleotide pyrophosphohydrolase [Propionibacteriaceae bacterium]
MSQPGIDDVLKAIRAFIRERDWEQFHSPENLAKSISIEAGELLELYQWGQPERAEDVEDELADVLTYCFQLADKLGVDPAEIMLRKLAKSAAKYPVEKARGRSTRYDELPD